MRRGRFGDVCGRGVKIFEQPGNGSCGRMLRKSEAALKQILCIEEAEFGAGALEHNRDEADAVPLGGRGEAEAGLVGIPGF